MTDADGRRADVLVVGAGLAGLTAARALVGAARTVIVLEADHRVGGRTAGGVTADGQWLELGGQWVSAEHTHLRQLVDAFGLRLLRAATSGLVLRVRDGRITTSEHDAGPPLPDDARREFDTAIAEFATMIEAIDLAEPWQTPEAELLDEQTFAGWIRAALPHPAARAQFITACAALFAPDPREVSLLHAAFYFRSNSLVDALRGIDRQAQEWRVEGGPSALCERMAADLGDAVHLSTPVRSLSHADGVVAITDTGTRFTAQHAIVTVPPPMAARLSYDPMMPSDRDQLTQRLHSIAVVKMYLVYSRPFWRDAGLSGEATIDGGPISVVLDNTPPDYRGGVLVTFVEGADSLRWGLHGVDARRDAFVREATRLFGEQAGRPVEYLECDWSNKEFTRGCYSGHFPPGAWTSYGPALTAPVGRIHWAGTETAREWTGYMEGAVRSGGRAAKDVLDAL